MEIRTRPGGWGIWMAAGLLAAWMVLPPMSEAGLIIGLRLQAEVDAPGTWTHPAPGGSFKVSDGVYQWLPNGGTVAPGTGTPVPVTMVARVIDATTGAVQVDPASAPLPVNLAVTNVSQKTPGDYTNDGIANPSPEQDFDEGVGNTWTTTMTLHPRDYGGWIQVGATGAASATMTLPFDSDGDGMPDDWENLVGLNPLVNDAGTDNESSGNVDSTGDGLTAFQEYRGFFWGDKAQHPDPNNVYATIAWLPLPTRSHVRTDPTRYDLFVVYGDFTGTYSGFSSNPATDPPFAIGDAFNQQGIEVHLWDKSGAWGDPRSFSQQNEIDLLDIVNDKANFFEADDGFINREMPIARDWSFDTLGQSSNGNETEYGSEVEPSHLAARVFDKSVTGYFENKPYEDLGDTEPTGHPDPFPTGANNMLDPTGGTCGVDWMVEDQDDDGVPTGGGPCTRGGSKEDFDKDGNLDGDHVDRAWVPPVSGHPKRDLSPYDVDQDDQNPYPGTGPHGVELPPDPTEYSEAQVLKQVITHEMGHAVGADHQTSDPAGIMYDATKDWHHDNRFASPAVVDVKIWIHNN